MSVRELRAPLDQVPDTRELILRREATWAPVHDAWFDAREDAADAYGDWVRTGSAEAYAAYRAAQDREDAAQDVLFRAVADARAAAAVAAAEPVLSARRAGVAGRP